MLNGIALWAAGLVIGVIAKDVLPKWWNKMMVKFRKDVKVKAKELLKDPEMRAWVAQGVALAQKAASSDSSINKLKLAGHWLKTKIPGPLDDALIDAMIELIVAELKDVIELD